MNELKRQRIKHMIEQGGYFDPKHPAICKWRILRYWPAAVGILALAAWLRF